MTRTCCCYFPPDPTSLLLIPCYSLCFATQWCLLFAQWLHLLDWVTRNSRASRLRGRDWVHLKSWNEIAVEENHINPWPTLRKMNSSCPLVSTSDMSLICVSSHTDMILNSFSLRKCEVFGRRNLEALCKTDLVAEYCKRLITSYYKVI